MWDQIKDIVDVKIREAMRVGCSGDMGRQGAQRRDTEVLKDFADRPECSETKAFDIDIITNEFVSLKNHMWQNVNRKDPDNVGCKCGWGVGTWVSDKAALQRSLLGFVPQVSIWPLAHPSWSSLGSGTTNATPTLSSATWKRNLSRNAQVPQGGHGGLRRIPEA